MAPKEKETIKMSKLLVAEGADCYYFLRAALDAFNVNDAQVLDFGGIGDLTPYLRNLPNIPGYEDVKVSTIVIVRDAETDPITAVSNVKSALQAAGFSVPDNPFEFTTGLPRVAFMIFPGFDADSEDQNTLLPGALEDLCIEIVRDTSTFECVDLYMKCLESNGQRITWPHKTKLHSYFAGKNGFVGMKIGEASRAGAWDWNHIRLEKFKNVITSM